MLNYYHKTNKFNYTISLLIFIFPLLFITGPALPDIFLTFITIYYLIYYIIYEKKYKIKPKWFYIGLIYCFGAIISSSLAYDFKLHSLTSSIFYFRFILFCFFLNYFFLKYPINFFIIINIIGASIFFVSIDICVQYFFVKDIFGFVSEFPIRNSGPFRDELIGGSYISKLFIPVFSIFYFLSLKNKFYKIINPFFFAICFFGLIFSGERSAILIFLLLILIFFFAIYVNELKKYFIIIISFLFLFIFSIFILLNDDLKERYFVTTFNDIKSFENIIDSRYGAHYLTAFNIFLDYPIKGIGQNNFRNKCSDEKYANLNSARIKNRCSTHPHNYYLQILSDLGIINFALFLILITSLFYQIFIFRNQIEKHIFYGKIVSLIVIFWPFLPTGSFYNNWNSGINWLVIAISIYFVDKNYSDNFLKFLKYK